MRIPRSPRRAKGRPRDRRFLVATALVVIVAFFATLSWPQSDVRLEPPRPSAALATTPAPAPGGSFDCDVAYVNDGDTLGCKDGTKVRLHAVAAREADETCSPGHPCPSASGASATAFLNRLAAGKTLTCEPTGQSYKRVTRHLPDGGRRRDQLRHGAQRNHPDLEQVRQAAPALQPMKP